MSDDTMTLWNQWNRPPQDALRAIPAGRLKGKTDINPVWRLQALTEAFGPVGDGWAYDVQDVAFHPGAGGEVACMVRVELRYRLRDGAWSEPIPGFGGSMFVASERDGLRTNDEAVKMAVTDALGTAMKALGVAADVYRGWADGGKYDRDEHRTATPPPSQARQAPAPAREGPPAPGRSSARPEGPPAGRRLLQGPPCPECSSAMEDNRAKIAEGGKFAKLPAFSCKADGCGIAVWERDRNGKTNPRFASLALAASGRDGSGAPPEEEGPPPYTDGDIPF
jgi:hypothetical protein